MAAHELQWLEQAEQIKEYNTFLTFEAAASPRKGLPPNQLRISQKLGAKQVLRTQSQNEVPRACIHTHFYMECDITLIVYVRMSRAQWWESL